MIEEKWGELTEYIRDFADSGIRDIIKGVSTDPVTGYDYIFTQIREIFIMAVCGACIAFLFEVYEGIYTIGREGGKQKIQRGARGKNAGNKDRQRRKLYISEKTMRTLLDFLFCVIAALVAARFWYISSCGRISFHETAALAGGILAGRSVFLFKNSKPVRALAVVYVIMLITAYIVIA